MNVRDGRRSRSSSLLLGVLAALPLSCGGGGGLGGSSDPAPSGARDAPIVPPVDASQPTLRSIDQCGRVTTSGQLSSDLSTTAGACLTVAANGVTIDGNGHRITAGQFAVALVDRSNVIVRRVVSDQGIQFYGAEANGNVLEDSSVGAVGIFMGDDTVIRNNRMTAFNISGLSNDPPLRGHVTGNTIEGLRKVLVHISPAGDGTDLCVRSDHEFTNNFVHSTRPTAPGDSETALLYLRCGTHNRVSGNTFRSEGLARGMYLRDEADDNTIEHNTVWIDQSDRGAFHMSSGNADKHHPRGNVIRGNFFRADGGRSIWIQARGFRDNTFTGNVFWSDFAEGARVAGGTGNVFDHNTFVNRATGNLLLLEAFVPPGNSYTANIFENSGSSVYDLSGAFDLSGYHGDDNVFFNRDGQVVFDSKKDLSAWQTATGADGNSLEADPQFLDPENGDFRLSATSPARGKASDGGDAGAGAAGSGL
jgi:hypothetical protein